MFCWRWDILENNAAADDRYRVSHAAHSNAKFGYVLFQHTWQHLWQPGLMHASAATQLPGVTQEQWKHQLF
jgi:hypothetical protein